MRGWVSVASGGGGLENEESVCGAVKDQRINSHSVLGAAYVGHGDTAPLTRAMCHRAAASAE